MAEFDPKKSVAERPGQNAALPGTKQNASIKPAASPVGFAAATAGLEASYETYGAIAAGISSDMSKQSAFMGGLEHGANLIKSPLPPITASDKVYKEAYRDESSKTIMINGQRIMANAHDEFMSNPRPDGQFLIKLHENVIKQYRQLADLADPTAKREIERSLYNLYDANFSKYGAAVSNEDNRKLLENTNLYIGGTIGQINELSSVGDFQGVEGLRQQTYKALQSLRAQKGEGAFIQGALELEMAVKAGKNNFEMMSHYNSSEGILGAYNYIKKYATTKHEGETQEERIALTQVMTQQLQEVERTTSIADNLLKNKAMIEMENHSLGVLSPSRFNYYKQNLSEEGFQAVEYAQTKALNVLVETSRLANMMNANQNNSAGLSMLSEEQRQRGYGLNKQTHEQNTNNGQPLNLQQEAEFARTYDTPINSFHARLAGAINSNNPEQAIQGAQVYKTMSLGNMNTMRGFDAKSALKAGMMNDLIAGNSTPLDAWKAANEQTANLTPKQIEDQKELFNDTLKLKKINAPTKQQAWVADAMGFKTSSDGLRSEYIDSLRNNYILAHGDFDQAQKLTTKQMGELWSETLVNGARQTMRLAPDRVSKQSDLEIRSQFVDKLGATFAQQQKIFDTDFENGVDFYYRFPEGEAERIKKGFSPGINWGGISEHVYQGLEVGATGAALGATAAGGYGALGGGIAGFALGAFSEVENPMVDHADYMYLERVSMGADGKLIAERGKVMMASDRLTELPPEGQLPSYAVSFLKDGDLLPSDVYSPIDASGRRNFQLLRFPVTPRTAEQSSREQQQLALKKQKAVEAFRLKTVNFDEDLYS